MCSGNSSPRTISYRPSSKRASDCRRKPSSTWPSRSRRLVVPKRLTPISRTAKTGALSTADHAPCRAEPTGPGRFRACGGSIPGRDRRSAHRLGSARHSARDVDIYQNRVLDPEKAQEARLQLVENFGPNSNWARANPSIATQANAAREEALRQSAQYRLSQAQQRNDRARFAEAAQLYGRYMQEFAQADSAQRASLLYGEALFGQGNYAEAGTQYARAAYEYSQRDTALAQRAGQNAIVAFDSALVRNKNDRGAQDAMFSAVDRYVAAFPETELAKRALIQKGKRASESQRWDVMATTFQTYAQRYPNDPYTPTAQKLVGDAMYRGGQYAEAQTQWESAQNIATSSDVARSLTRFRAFARAPLRRSPIPW